MSRDLEDVLREIGELSNIHADRKKLRANLLEIRDHRLAYYNQSNEKELHAEFSDDMIKILLLQIDLQTPHTGEIRPHYVLSKSNGIYSKCLFPFRF